MNGKHHLTQLQQIAESAAAGRMTFSHGEVTEFDPSSYAVKVLLRPLELETGWIPLRSPWTGNGWGMFAPPDIGDPVTVDFDGGQAEAGIAGERYFTREQRPLPVQPGELWLVHQSGAAVKLRNDGSLQLSDGHGAVVSLQGDGSIQSTGAWVHTGPLTVAQDFVVQGNAAVTGNVMSGGIVGAAEFEITG